MFEQQQTLTLSTLLEQLQQLLSQLSVKIFLVSTMVQVLSGISLHMVLLELELTSLVDRTLLNIYFLGGGFYIPHSF